MTHSTKSASELSESPHFGPRRLEDGSVVFSLWAPSAKSVELILYSETGEIQLPPTEVIDSWYTFRTQAPIGSLYHFYIDDRLRVPDPASRQQAQDINGPSCLYDENAFQWSQEWHGRDWAEAVIYELHVGTFTKEGTFKAAQEKLEFLSKCGITAIEIMPIADFPGRFNWGYDGVLLYAPDNTYGTPDDLKRLIQSAHNLGMMVFLDVVYNHFGPEGNYIGAYARQFFNEAKHTPWGAAINFDGKLSSAVRKFYRENALYWIEKFKFDGLRFDAVHAIQDSSTPTILQDIAIAIKNGPGQDRKIHLILENDDNTAMHLERDIDMTSKYYTAQWNDDIHHCLHIISTEEIDGYYADYHLNTSSKSTMQHLLQCLTSGFAYQGERSGLRRGALRGSNSQKLPPTAFVSFTQNHDQIGNRPLGDRISVIGDKGATAITREILLLSPQIPLVFMGQEFDAESPFYYFCDMGPELAKLIKEGRRSEFSHFKEFADLEGQKLIPDPGAEETFKKSKLNWKLNSAAKKNLKIFSEILEVRRKWVTPLNKLNVLPVATGKEIGDQMILVHWKYGKRRLSLLANLSARVQLLKDEILKDLAHDQIIWDSNRTMQTPRAGALEPWTTYWCINDNH